MNDQPEHKDELEEEEVAFNFPPPPDLTRTCNTSNSSNFTFGLGTMGLDENFFRSPMEDLVSLVAGAGAAVASKYSHTNYIALTKVLF